MKLTDKELEKVNTIPSLAALCKVVIDVSEHGTDKQYCFEVMEALIPLFKKRCRLFRIIEQ